MDNESLRGKTLILNYIVKTYEENIINKYKYFWNYRKFYTKNII